DEIARRIEKAELRIEKANAPQGKRSAQCPMLNAQFSIHQRTGINAGPVLAGLVGTPARWEYTVMGDSANVAARLMGKGDLQASEVLIGPSVQAQVGELLVSSSRTLALKGKSEPLPVWSVDALQRGVQPRLVQSNPLVGRASELAALRGATSGL